MTSVYRSEGNFLLVRFADVDSRCAAPRRGRRGATCALCPAGTRLHLHRNPDENAAMLGASQDDGTVFFRSA